MKQVTKKGNVPSTKGKLPHRKKPKPFKENVQSIKGELPHGKKPMPFKGNSTNSSLYCAV
jgi:hypothetical protein